MVTRSKVKQLRSISRDGTSTASKVEEDRSNIDKKKRHPIRKRKDETSTSTKVEEEHSNTKSKKRQSIRKGKDCASIAPKVEEDCSNIEKKTRQSIRKRKDDAPTATKVGEHCNVEKKTRRSNMKRKDDASDSTKVDEEHSDIERKTRQSIKKRTDDDSTATKVYEEHSIMEERALTLPDIEITDLERFPCYSSIINRDVDQPVLSEDLDRLQMELEFMLSNVVVENRLLRLQVDIIDVAQNSTPRKIADLSISKKDEQKSDTNRSGHSDGKNDLLKRTKLEISSLKEIENNELDDDTENEPLSKRIRRSTGAVPTWITTTANCDMSNAFWKFVDQYCGEIKPENIQFLGELIKNYNDCDELETIDGGNIITPSLDTIDHGEKSYSKTPKIPNKIVNDGEKARYSKTLNKIVDDDDEPCCSNIVKKIVNDGENPSCSKTLNKLVNDGEKPCCSKTLNKIVNDDEKPRYSKTHNKIVNDGAKPCCSKTLNETIIDAVEQPVLRNFRYDALRYNHDNDKLETEGEGVNDKTISTPFDKLFKEGTIVQRMTALLIEQTQPSTSRSSMTVVGDDEIDPDVDDVDKYGDDYYKRQLKKLTDACMGFTSSGVEEYTELEEAYRKLPLFHTPLCFEPEVRKKLERYGFIKAPAPYSDDDDSDDEILREIKRCERELKPRADRTKHMLNMLLTKAKREIIRQDIKREIGHLNKQIADMCLKAETLSVSKKNLNPLEAGNSWRLLKKRQMLQKKLAETTEMEEMTEM